MNNDSAKLKSRLPGLLHPKSILLALAFIQFFWESSRLYGCPSFWDLSGSFSLIAAAGALWLSRAWSYLAASILAGRGLYFAGYLILGFDDGFSASDWWRVATHNPEIFLQVGLSVVVFCYAAICLLKGLLARRPAFFE
jgi:hypothetical protein